MHCNCPTHSPDRPPEPVQYATIDGIVRTTYLTDGRILCQICMHHKWPCEMHVDRDGCLNDICTPCAHIEGEATHAPE